MIRLNKKRPQPGGRTEAVLEGIYTSLLGADLVGTPNNSQAQKPFHLQYPNFCLIRVHPHDIQQFCINRVDFRGF
jgi:hypothetical protein